MGNTSSNTSNKNNLKNNLKNNIDQIAADLILDTSNKELTKLLEVSYCNVILNQTHNSLNNNFTKTQLEIINGTIMNTLPDLQDYISLNTNDIEKNFKLIENMHVTKKKLCHNISIFYTKIVHLYAAIYKVIGEQSICALKKDIHTIKTKKNAHAENDVVYIKSNYCKKNKMLNTNFLTDEVGIPELEELYKDKFDEETRTFYMSDEQKEKYKTDVNLFYKTYTGKENNGTIKSFKEIPIFDYSTGPRCSEEKKRNSSKNYVGIDSNYNIKKFAEHLSNIMNHANTTQLVLVDFLENIIFKKTETSYIINPNLNMAILDDIIEKTRKIIVNMFIECEEKYQKAVTLFKTIIFDKNISISEKRVKNIRNKKFDSVFDMINKEKQNN